MVDLTTRLADATLPNPVMTASGCAAAGRELAQFFDVAELGAVVTKSIMLDPRSGRPTPRMAETPSGMLNSIGLQGPGIDGSTALRASIQPRDLFERLAVNVALFPRGIDVVLVHDDAIVAIPRTTRLAAKGG